MSRERRRTFTVLPLAHRVHSCSRCHCQLWQGERATAILTPGRAEFRHAGRKCPPGRLYKHRPL